MYVKLHIYKMHKNYSPQISKKFVYTGTYLHGIKSFYLFLYLTCRSKLFIDIVNSFHVSYEIDGHIDDFQDGLY